MSAASTSDKPISGASTSAASMAGAKVVSRRKRFELQDRDRQLMAFLALSRHLSTEQIARLVFAGRARSTIAERLLTLGGTGRWAVERPFLSRTAYRTFEGSMVPVWGLTELGYATASLVLGAAKKPPLFALSKEFLEHTILLNDIFVGLAAGPTAPDATHVPRRRLRNAREGAYAVARALPFRWISSEGARLPWAEYDATRGGVRGRFIQPDAVLELGSQKRRLFLECETGSHTIIPVGPDKAEAKPGSTWAKVERYDCYLNDFVDSSKKTTAYALAYKDGFAPEVWFVVPGERRAQGIQSAIARWQKENGRTALQARAFTFARAVREVRSSLGLPVASDAAPSGEAVAPGAAPPVSGLTQKEVHWLTDFYAACVSRIKEVRRVARERREPPPEYPPHLDEVRALLSKLLEAQGAAPLETHP